MVNLKVGDRVVITNPRMSGIPSSQKGKEAVVTYVHLKEVNVRTDGGVNWYVNPRTDTVTCEGPW